MIVAGNGVGTVDQDEASSAGAGVESIVAVVAGTAGVISAAAILINGIILTGSSAAGDSSGAGTLAAMEPANAASCLSKCAGTVYVGRVTA